MILQPGEVFVPSSRVDDEQKFLLVDPVNDQIINDSASLVKEKSVLAHAYLEFVDIVCQHDVEPSAGARSFDDQLPHVRNVEDADVVSHSLMFLDNARVLHRHEPSGEWNHLRAQPHMLAVKRRLAVFAVRHERQPRLSGSYRKQMDIDSSALSSPRSRGRGKDPVRHTFLTRADVKSVSPFPKGRGLR